ncbi:hypothetical protein Bca52824_023462 [Brassica carinata]|uniref:Retrotransposon Copia-like N-terminal domain-containing protein n=1 Tax=Brassica carinata TaxID=52824 RepID=A0A8X8AT40_BRACI|nr:hypothetical protein Bca52824_023462 [Brassica carinata]
MEGGGGYMKVATTFKGNNYLVWSRMARNAVGSKGLLKHLTADESKKLITQGKDGEDSSVRQQEECVVLSALLASLEPTLMDAYSYSETYKGFCRRK